MALATVYVLPAEREPYPMAVLEAMSVGLVVVSPTAVWRRWLGDSCCGRVAEGAVEDLARAVRTVLAEECAYSRRARKPHAATSMCAVASQLFTVYRQAVDR